MFNFATQIANTYSTGYTLNQPLMANCQSPIIEYEIFSGPQSIVYYQYTVHDTYTRKNVIK